MKQRRSRVPDPSDSSAASTTWASVKGRMQSMWGTVRQYPSTLIIPLLVLLGLVAVGVTVVLVASNAAATSSKDQATLDAKAAAELLTQVLHDTMQPTHSMGLFIQTHPFYPEVLLQFPGVAKELLDQVGHLNSTFGLQLAPRAQITAVYPESKNSKKSIGLDLVEDHVTLVNLKQPPGHRLTLNGPILLYNEKVWAMIGAAIVFVPNATRNETFGMPPSIRECTPPLESLCYDESTKSKFWGIVYSIIYLDSFVTGPSTAVSSLRNKDYTYLLVQEPKDGSGPATVLAQSDSDLSSDPVVVVIDVQQVASFIPWTLMISKSIGWEPSWKDPLLATVVVVSFVIAILLFILLLYMRQHQRLLYALMPRKLVQSMFQGDSFEAVLKDGALMLQAGTPMEKLMDILGQFMKGETPDMHDVIALRAAFMHGGEGMFEPENLRGQLQLNKELADDVVNALVRELQGLGPGSNQTSILYKHSNTASLTDDMCLLGRTTAALSFIMKSHKPPEQPLDTLGLRSSVGSVGRGFLASASRVFLTSKSLLPSSEDPPDTQRDSPCEVFIDVQASGGETCIVNAAGKAMNPCHAPSDQVHLLLEAGYGSWSFDSFALSEATDGHPLSVMFYFLLARSGLIKDLKLNPATVTRLSLAMEDGYQSNPYHNKIHAADVLQTMHAILLNTGMVVAADQKGYCPPLTLLACLLAAAGHDLDHKGVTNDFLICSEDQLATLYSDKSPMEHHHLAYLWTLLKNPSFNILSRLSKEESNKIRKTVIDLVSATDMKTHFSILSQFSIIHQLSGSTSTPQAASPHGRCAGVPALPSPDANSSVSCSGGGSFQAYSSRAAAHHCIPMDDSELILSLQIALKCADLGHIAETVEVHRRWVTCLEAEFFEQGDREKALGFPISPLFDRTKPGASKSQVGFYDFVVFPLFHNFSCAFPGAKPMVDLALTTYKFWKAAAPATDPAP